MAKMKTITSGPKGGNFGLVKGSKVVSPTNAPIASAPIPVMNTTPKVKAK